jgi:tetratricopeptide (TPR) repeat protein
VRIFERNSDLIPKNIIIIGIIFLLVSSLVAQDVESLIREYKNGNRDNVITALDTLIYKHPDHPGVKYLRALVQDNALMSTGIFKDIMRKYPENDYAKLAQVKVAEYYFSQGLYRQSRELFKEALLYNLPETEIIRIGNQCLRAGIASRMIDSAKDDLSFMQKKYADIIFDIPKELEPFVSKIIIEPTNPIEMPKTGLRPLGQDHISSQNLTSDKGLFGLQIAAFSSLNNAEATLQDIEALHRRGEIKTKVVNGKTLHVVIVGRYATREDAESDQKNINHKLNSSSFIIRFE